MKLHRLSVKNFRLIRSLEWHVAEDLICLLGSGDSGKTCLLDAIDWALWPRWALPISDADFHGLNVEDPIVIELAVGDVPEELVTDQSFAVNQRFICGNGEIHDEPIHDEDQTVLSVRLTIDRSLDPRWEIVCGDRQPARTISWHQRAALGGSRLGGDPDRHLRWGRGSALERLGGGSDQATEMLADVYRDARRGITPAHLSALDDTVAAARAAAPAYGARLDPELIEAAIDPAALDPSAAGLALHHAGIPVRMAGLGTRRLAALAIQARAVTRGAIILIDEIENGLEPFRLRHLLSTLRSRLGSDGSDNPSPGQIFMTTHSPLTLMELDSNHLHILRTSQDGAAAITQVGASLQALARSQPDTLLASKVIVAEGSTEFGLLRGLELVWRSEVGAMPMAHRGTTIANGRGKDTAANVALQLATLGFGSALLVDGDQPIQPPVEQLEAAGVFVAQWGDSADTEQRLSSDLPLDGLLALLDVIGTSKGEAQVKGEISVRLSSPPDEETSLPNLAEAVGEAAFRVATAKALRECRWIKAIAEAQGVGVVVAGYLSDIVGTDLEQKLSALREWGHHV